MYCVSHWLKKVHNTGEYLRVLLDYDIARLHGYVLYVLYVCFAIVLLFMSAYTHVACVRVWMCVSMSVYTHVACVKSVDVCVFMSAYTLVACVRVWMCVCLCLLILMLLV